VRFLLRCYWPWPWPDAANGPYYDDSDAVGKSLASKLQRGANSDYENTRADCAKTNAAVNRAVAMGASDASSQDDLKDLCRRPRASVDCLGQSATIFQCHIEWTRGGGHGEGETSTVEVDVSTDGDKWISRSS
jgi:hypothetical protein